MEGPDDLSAEQRNAVNAALNGASVFLTGAAGTGKSKTLLTIIQKLRNEKYTNQPKAVAVVAPTGYAALHIGGQTIHSWLGIGVTQTAGRPGVWKQLRVLIIDEVSMVADHMLDMLDRVARTARSKPDEPFGGVQLILCGDFLQLPPINAQFCFQSRAWKHLNPMCIELTFSYRQSADAAFATILARIRRGECDEATLHLLLQHQRSHSDGIVPTELHATKKGVEEQNALELAKLPGTSVIFSAQDRGSAALLKRISNWCNAQTTLALKVGAQVVLLRNTDMARGLVNGSRGVVVGFDDNNLPVVKFASNVTLSVAPVAWTCATEDGNSNATRTQIPLDLAWALTIHKSQGMSIDRMCANLTSSFGYGMAHVALSRCRTLEGLHVKGLTLANIKAHPEALAFHDSIKGRGEEPRQKRAKNE